MNDRAMYRPRPRPLALSLAVLLPVVAACSQPPAPAGQPAGELPAAASPDPATAASPAAPDPAAPPPMPTPTADAAPLLPAYHWRLASATDPAGARIDALFARADAPLQLDFADGRVAVSNTCNRMAGGYTLDGGSLTFSPLAATMMACVDPALSALDAEVGKRLAGTLTVAATAGDTPELALANAGGDRLVFQGTPTPTTRYGGQPERIFLEVAAQTRPCSHPLMPARQCLQVREVPYDGQMLQHGQAGEWRNFYDSIDGYSHTPGIRNVLRINRFTRQNPPADASRYAYVLDMVVESEKVQP